MPKMAANIGAETNNHTNRLVCRSLKTKNKQKQFKCPTRKIILSNRNGLKCCYMYVEQNENLY